MMSSESRFALFGIMLWSRAALGTERGSDKFHHRDELK
jgi:hypothetical protein